MNEDRSNIIPINRGIIKELEELLKSVKYTRSNETVNATLITKEGFMRQEKVNHGDYIITVARYPKINTVVKDCASSELVGIEKMTFKLDRFMSTKDHFVYREI